MNAHRESESGLDTWSILIIVIAVVTALGLLVGLVLLHRRKNLAEKKHPKNENQLGQHDLCNESQKFSENSNIPVDISEEERSRTQLCESEHTPGKQHGEMDVCSELAAHRPAGLDMGVVFGSTPSSTTIGNSTQETDSPSAEQEQALAEPEQNFKVVHMSAAGAVQRTIQTGKKEYCVDCPNGIDAISPQDVFILAEEFTFLPFDELIDAPEKHTCNCEFPLCDVKRSTLNSI